MDRGCVEGAIEVADILCSHFSDCLTLSLDQEQTKSFVKLVIVIQANAKSANELRSSSLLTVFTRLNPLEQCIGLLAAEETIHQLGGEVGGLNYQVYRTLCRLLPFNCNFYGDGVTEVIHRVMQLYLKLGDQDLLAYFIGKLYTDPQQGQPDKRNLLIEPILNSKEVWDYAKPLVNGMNILRNLIQVRISSIRANRSLENNCTRFSLSSLVLQVIKMEADESVENNLTNLIADCTGQTLLHLICDLKLPCFSGQIVKNIYEQFVLNLSSEVVFKAAFVDVIKLFKVFPDLKSLLSSFIEKICSELAKNDANHRHKWTIFQHILLMEYNDDHLVLVLKTCYTAISAYLKSAISSSTEDKPSSADCAALITFLLFLERGKGEKSPSFSQIYIYIHWNLIHGNVCNLLNRVFIEEPSSLKTFPRYTDRHVVTVFNYLLWLIDETQSNVVPPQLQLAFTRKILDAYPTKEDNPFVLILVSAAKTRQLVLSSSSLDNRAAFSLLLDRRIFSLKSQGSATNSLIQQELSKLEELQTKLMTLNTEPLLSSE